MTFGLRLLRVPTTVLALGVLFAVIAPLAMTSYEPFTLAPGIGPSIRVTGTGPGTGLLRHFNLDDSRCEFLLRSILEKQPAPLSPVF